MDVSELELQDLYTWVDEIPLSRPKRNIARDFSDGVLAAEIVHHYFPKLVEMHNYSSANATTQKMYNWNTLNNKVFKRLGFTLSKPEFEAVANCQAGAVERVLKLLRARITKCREEGFTGTSAPTLVPVATAAPQAAAVQRAGLAEPAGAYSSHSHNAAGAGPGAALREAAYAPAAPLPYHAQLHQGPGSRGGVPVNHQAGGLQSLGHAAGRGVAGKVAMASVPAELLADREQIIAELRETNEILETKVRKLEQLVRLKDAKISTLMAKLQSANLA